MTIEATVLEELTEELTQLAEWLKQGTQRGTPGREYVNGVFRDLYMLEQTVQSTQPEGDHAAWLAPFVETAIAKLTLGKTIFPQAGERLDAAAAKLEELRSRNDLLASLRREALDLLETDDALHPQAWAVLERGHVLEGLRSPQLLRGRKGAGPPELAFAGRLLEGLGLHLALSLAADRPSPSDAAVQSLANRVEGWLEEHGADPLRPEQGASAKGLRKVEAPERIPELPLGCVHRCTTAGFSLNGDRLAQPVAVVSPGAETHLASAVRKAVEAAAEGMRTLVQPRVKALTTALYKRLDDPSADQTARAEAALDLIEAVRPLLAEDPSAMGPLLQALGRDFGGADAELILPTPGSPMAPDPGWSAVDVFSRSAPAGEIVALLRPGLKLGGQVVRPALVQVSQGEPPPGPLDEIVELIPDDDPRGPHIKDRLERARCLAAGDAGAALGRELTDLALFMRDDILMEPAQRAMRQVIDDPPAQLAEVDGWESVREFLDEHLETLYEEEQGQLAIYRLVRPYFQGLRTGELSGARLRSLGESMGPMLQLFDEMMAATAREWLFSELERLGSEGLRPGGHTRRLVRTAAKAVKTFYDNNELTSAIELTQALTRSGLNVYPEDGEQLNECPAPEELFHRLEAVYTDEPRGKVLGDFEPAVSTGGEERVRETGAISLSLGPEPPTIQWLKDEEIRASRLGAASHRLVKELRLLDRERLVGELKGDAGAEWTFAQKAGELFSDVLAEAGWRRSDEERRVLGKLFEHLDEDFHLLILPGYLSYRRLKELHSKLGHKVNVEIVREGAKQITLDSIGAVYRDELLLPLDMVWCTGPPPPYVDHLRKIAWFDAVLKGQDPGIEMTPAAREAIQDFDSPDAQSLEGIVEAISTVVTWLATEHPHLLGEFQNVVKNAPGLELTFFPLPAQCYTNEQLVQALDKSDSPDALQVVRDASREDGYTLSVDRIAVYQKGRRLSEEPRAKFSLKTLPRACESMQEAFKPLFGSKNVTATVKSQLRGYVTRMALIPEGAGQTQVELEAFKTLLEGHLIDPSYAESPSNSLHDAGAYLAGQLQAKGLMSVERFEGKRTIDEALKDAPANAADIDEIFCMAGMPELAEVKRPLVQLEGSIIQKAFLLRGVPTSDVDVLELDKVLVDSLDRLRDWQEGVGALVDPILASKQRQVVPRTIKRITDVRTKMLKAHKKQQLVLPPDTQRRDLIRFIVDQIHRAEDTYAVLEDKSYRGAFGELVFKDVVFRSASPYLSKNWNISIDTAVVAGADTQALVGKFKKESGGPAPKRENAKIYSVVLPCYAQDGVTIRPAVVRVGDF